MGERGKRRGAARAAGKKRPGATTRRQTGKPSSDGAAQLAAVSEILKVISSSPSDVQPVFETIISNAVRLGSADFGSVVKLEGGVLKVAARFTMKPEAHTPVRTTFPLDRDTVFGRAVVDREVVNLADYSESDFASSSRESARRLETRATLVVPMMCRGKPIGAIAIARRQSGVFSEGHVALLKTFADQAVIAIENTRLFNETKESLEHQTAMSNVLHVISTSATDVQPVLDAVASSAVRLTGAISAAIVLLRKGWLGKEWFHLVAIASAAPAYETKLRSAFLSSLDQDVTEAAGAHKNTTPGGVIMDRLYTHFPDNAHSVAMRLIVRPGHGSPIGALIVIREGPGLFTDKHKASLTMLTRQTEIAIENARLFREIQDKSAQLEVANKHKSDFLAHMSHELRTPLNAIIGFSEVLRERMFGELNDKQADYLKDIHESGQHLLSLINDILDLSKIEAGRMELELSNFHLPTAISNALVLVRERAMRHGVQLHSEIDPRLAEFQADERKVKQVLLNLLSNAVKFTPEGGRVDVSAKLDTDCVEIAVRDTGAGIAPEDQASLFEEFKQVGRDSARKAEGTGLGLALTKRFVELHGGKIRVDSAPGKGSTFAFTLPVR